MIAMLDTVWLQCCWFLSNIWYRWAKWMLWWYWAYRYDCILGIKYGGDASNTLV